MIHQLYIYIYIHIYIYYCITWWWSVPNQTVEGGSPLTPMVPAHLSIPLITYRGTGTRHRQCVSSWWPLDWFGYLHKSDWWGVPLDFIYIHWSGQGWPMVACPFRALVVLYRMLPIFTEYKIFNVWATVATICPPPTDFLFEKRIGLLSMDLLCITFTYHTQDNQQECFRRMNYLPPV